MKYHVELVGQHRLDNASKPSCLLGRLEILGKAGWKYVDHVLVDSFNHGKDPNKTYVFSLIMEREDDK